MQKLRFLRWLLLIVVLVPFVPATARGAVFISVGFAPPPLLVYQQPLCPEPGWMWVPGYWAYGEDGYYWVPGTWVPAPYEGALWTPGYWGWNTGFYIWHPGYWGRQVGYYGGINYGFGYFGIGFVGGRWHQNRFMYNTAVMRVDRSFIRDTYIDRRAIERNTIRNERRVAYNGGPGGIRHNPTAQDRITDREQRMGRTALQNEHVNAAMHDRTAYYRNNQGRPPVVTQQRPRTMRDGGRGEIGPGGRATPQRTPEQQRPQAQQRQQEQMRQQPQARPRPEIQQRPQGQQRQPEQMRQQPQSRPRPEIQQRPQGQQRQQEQMRPQPQAQQRAPEQRRQPAAQPQREQRQERPQQRGEDRGRGR